MTTNEEIKANLVDDLRRAEANTRVLRDWLEAKRLELNNASDDDLTATASMAAAVAEHTKTAFEVVRLDLDSADQLDENKELVEGGWL